MHTQPMLRDGALEGKVIIVTGGGTGLGKSMTRYFLQLGAKVIITSRKLPVLEQTAKELMQETNGTVLPLACDVREYEQVQNVLKLSIEKFGHVNALLNNAAGNFISPTEKLSPNAFNSVVDIVLRGTYNFSLALGKYWIENNLKGTMLNIVTTYAFTGSAYVVPSATAKAGVLALTRSLAVEWAPYGIRTNAIAPGPFPTPGAWARLFPEEQLGKELADKINPINRVPLGRAGEHQELANLAGYLMSDYSAYVNGEVVVIDGGEWLQGAGEFSHLKAIPKHAWDQIEASIRKK
jgi:NAD(P)-dependent dehydrogenase (short-subunit alcohol dehydrogenase family)